MEEVLDIYKRPYDARGTLVCMDESPRQLIREKPLVAPEEIASESCGVWGPVLVLRHLWEERYILKTDVSEITAVEAYKELSVMESGFRDLQDVLAIRPVWPKTDRRVRAHIFVATRGCF